ncbi:mitogen-activated protein kinase kinase kinase kinase 5-like [Rhopilema esculentum]|uniref:mitogen-activated protein kinase kinase kinase kinase 5-like n=1 Tax=Rhopilema esculentum TaxID=499914 RepID=UPI0031CF6DCD|eukprot:gene13196-4005_t
MSAAHSRANILHRNPENDFELIQKIGSGTYGEVYKARVKATGSMAAVKIVHIDAGDDFDIIQQEIVLMQDCKHHNIVQYLGSYLRRDKLWIAMEFCGGGSLQDIYHVTGPLAEKQIAFTCTEMLKGLSYLHGSGKIHRDIKGANILVTDDGNIKLADFGVSAQITATLNKRNSFIGTPYWMAPEVAAVERTGGYDHQCDIWAVGITAIELAELQPPLFDLHPMRALYLISKRNYTPPNVKEKNKWSSDMRDFIKQSLTKNPKKRPPADKLLQHNFCSLGAGGRKFVVELLSRHAQLKEKKQFRYSGEPEPESVEQKEQEKSEKTVKRIKSKKNKKMKDRAEAANVDMPENPSPIKKEVDPREDGTFRRQSKIDDAGTLVVKHPSQNDNSQEGSTIKAALRPMQPLPNDAAPPIPPKTITRDRGSPEFHAPPVPPRPRGEDSEEDPPPLPPRKPSARPGSQAFINNTPRNCFTKVFNECPLTIHCASSWTHPENRNHFLLFASSEGIYSLNLDDTSNVEMVQVYLQPCTWLYVIKNILVSISGSPPSIYMHNLMALFAASSGEQYVPQPREIPMTSKVTGTQGVRKCCVVHNPYNNQIYMCAALVNSVLLLQWYEPLQKFMTVKNFPCNLPDSLNLFEAIVIKGSEYPLVCLGVYLRKDGSFFFDKVDLKAASNWFLHEDSKPLDVTTFSQLERDVILISYGRTVVFVNVDGQKKLIRGHVTQLEFDNDVESTVCLPGGVLTFHKYGIQGKSLLDGRPTGQFNDTTRLYRLLGSDRIVVMESRIPEELSSNLFILASG